MSRLVVDDKHGELDHVAPGGAARPENDFQVGESAVELSVKAAVAGEDLPLVDADLSGHVEVTQALVFDHYNLAEGG
jgi:hypothetical protein